MTERSNVSTVKLYETDAELRSFNATAIKCDAVVLDQTAFFQTGGGQTCDTGFIGAARVTDVSVIDGEILHKTSEELEIGREYHCVLDYDVRAEKMRSHTAEHILSSYLFKIYGFKNVGFHLGDSDTTCDFDGRLSRDMLSEAEAYGNAVVMEDHPVYALFPFSEELKTLCYRSKLELASNVRIVAVGKNGEIDLCACCAPQVTSTGQIGYFKIVDA